MKGRTAHIPFQTFILSTVDEGVTVKRLKGYPAHGNWATSTECTMGQSYKRTVSQVNADLYFAPDRGLVSSKRRRSQAPETVLADELYLMEQVSPSLHYTDAREHSLHTLTRNRARALDILSDAWKTSAHHGPRPSLVRMSILWATNAVIDR